MGVTAAVTAGMTLASGAIGAYGQYSSGKINQRMANLNAEYNELQARDALERGDEEATEMRKTTRQVIGAQRAKQGASGVDVNSGSAVDVQADTAVIGEQDALTIKSNAMREALGYRLGASDYRARGAIERTQSKMAAYGTLLSSGSQAVSMAGRK